MTENTQTRIDTLCGKIRDAFSNKYWQEDLETALSVVTFTPAQIEKINAAATTTLKQNFETAASMGRPMQTNLTHAFEDAVSKICTTIETPAMQFNPKNNTALLTDLHHILTDIFHNYPRLLGEEMPGSIQTILNLYKDEILPETDALLKELQDPEYFQNLPELGKGYDHLRTLEHWPD